MSTRRNLTKEKRNYYYNRYIDLRVNLHLTTKHIAERLDIPYETLRTIIRRNNTKD